MAHGQAGGRVVGGRAGCGRSGGCLGPAARGDASGLGLCAPADDGAPPVGGAAGGCRHWPAAAGERRPARKQFTGDAGSAQAASA